MITLAQATLPVTGVDVAGSVSLVIAALGAVVGVVVGGYFAFCLIRKSMMWGSAVDKHYLTAKDWDDSAGYLHNADYYVEGEKFHYLDPDTGEYIGWDRGDQA